MVREYTLINDEKHKKIEKLQRDKEELSASHRGLQGEAERLREENIKKEAIIQEQASQLKSCDRLLHRIDFVGLESKTSPYRKKTLGSKQNE
jgi:hypothetical protein